MHGRREYLGKQRKLEKCDGVGRRIQEGLWQGRRRRSKMTRNRRRQKDVQQKITWEIHGKGTLWME